MNAKHCHAVSLAWGVIQKTSSLKKAFAQWSGARRQRVSGVDTRTAFSIAIESPCVVCQPRVASDLASYLNEFDELRDGGSWLYVNDHRLEQLQAFPDFEAETLEHSLDFLTARGGVILEMPDCHRPGHEAEQVFQVKLSCQEPEGNQHHLWLNAKRMSPDALKLIIANSFIDWANLGGDPA